jgi:hypothetical protein
VDSVTHSSFNVSANRSKTSCTVADSHTAIIGILLTNRLQFQIIDQAVNLALRRPNPGTAQIDSVCGCVVLDASSEIFLRFDEMPIQVGCSAGAGLKAGQLVGYCETGEAAADDEDC